MNLSLQTTLIIYWFDPGIVIKAWKETYFRFMAIFISLLKQWIIGSIDIIAWRFIAMRAVGNTQWTSSNCPVWSCHRTIARLIYQWKKNSRLISSKPCVCCHSHMYFVARNFKFNIQRTVPDTIMAYTAENAVVRGGKITGMQWTDWALRDVKSIRSSFSFVSIHLVISHHGTQLVCEL